MTVQSTPQPRPIAFDVERQAWSPSALRTAWALVLLGTLLRVALFAANRPLWIDESMLAGNLVERSYSRLLEPLDNGQLGSVGFLLTSRLIVDVLGPGERALRLLPLLAGLACLPAFLLVCRRLLPARAGLWALLLAAVSEPLVYYSAELRPYSLDVLAGLLIFWLALHVWQRGYRAADAAALALLCVVSLLFSYAMVFVIAATLSWLIVAAWLRGGGGRVSAGVLAAGAAVSGGLFLYLQTQFMGASKATEHQLGFWVDRQGFAPLPPRNAEDLLWYVLRPLDYFVDPMRYNAFGLALVLAVIGAVTLWRRSRFAAMLALSPMAMVLVASAAKKYPFGTAAEIHFPMLGRVLLFLVPATFILMGLGLDELGRATRSLGRFVMPAVIVVLLLQPSLLILQHIKNRHGVHDLRPALAYLQREAEPGDVVYQSWPARMACQYYGRLIPLPAGVELAPPMKDLWINVTGWNKYRRDFESLRGKRVWVMFVYAPDREIDRPNEKFLRDWLGQTAPPLARYDQHNVTLTLFDLRTPAASPAVLHD